MDEGSSGTSWWCHESSPRGVYTLSCLLTQHFSDLTLSLDFWLTYLPTRSTDLPTSLPPDLPTRPTHVSTSLPPDLSAYLDLSTRLTQPTYLPPDLPTRPTCLTTYYQPTSWLAYLLPTSWPTYFLTLLSLYLHTSFPTPMYAHNILPTCLSYVFTVYICTYHVYLPVVCIQSSSKQCETSY